MQAHMLAGGARQPGPVDRLDPRLKIIATLLFVVGIVTTPPARHAAFGAYALFALTLILVGRVSPRVIVKRLLAIVPFVLLTAAALALGSEHGMGAFDRESGLLPGVAIKAALSATAMILLSATTSFPDLVGALEQLHFPKVMLATLSLMYRYLFVAADQTTRMNRAREARTCGGRRLAQYRALGTLIGLLLIRSYERAERVYTAMLSRGYDGTPRRVTTLAFSRTDYRCMVLFGCAMAAILMVSHA